jgi:hypothetical protein
MRGPVKEALAIVFDSNNDEALRPDITYRLFVSRTFDQSLKRHVTTFTNYPIGAVKLQHTSKSTLVGSSGIQEGDEAYLIQGSEAPSGMSLKDEIIDENQQTKKIKAINHIFGFASIVTIEASS